MSLEDWTSTPNSSNITESAHVETNCYTGTRLSLLEGIDSAHKFNKLMEDKVRIAQETGVLPNHLNTEKHRMNKNLGWAIKRSKAAMENQRAEVKLDNLNTQLADARATVRALEQEKKQLHQETSPSMGQGNAILPSTWANPGLAGDRLGLRGSGSRGSYSFEWPFLRSQFEFDKNTYLRGL
ncbi:hypothetical protein V8D89_014114 [Ganoderma adspersum]